MMKEVLHPSGVRDRSSPRVTGLSCASGGCRQPSVHRVPHPKQWARTISQRSSAHLWNSLWESRQNKEPGTRHAAHHQPTSTRSCTSPLQQCALRHRQAPPLQHLVYLEMKPAHRSSIISFPPFCNWRGQ